MTKNNNILHAKSSSGEREKLWVDSQDIRKLIKEVYDEKIFLLFLFKTRITWRARPVVDCVCFEFIIRSTEQNFRHLATTQL